MQIKTIHKMQNALDKAIKVVKFAWRHFFVFCVVGITVNGIASGNIPYFDKLLMISAVAFLIDWVKTKIKFSEAASIPKGANSISSFSDKNYWNSGIVGTSSYLSSIGNSFSKYR